MIIYMGHFSGICVTGQAHMLFLLCPHQFYSAPAESMVKLVLASQTAQANSVLPEEHHMLEILVHFHQIVLCNE